MTRPKHSIEKVKAEVLKYKESGLNVAEYCRQNNFSSNQLRWFIRRLENQKFRQEEQPKSGFTKIPGFVDTVKSIIKITFREFEIEVPDNVNQETLHKVIKVLKKSHV
jgi:transposase-like protein